MIDIESLGRRYGPEIEKEIRSVLSGRLPNLHDAIEYHMGTGGKKLRPLLAIMTCRALGADERKIMPFAAACELFHNWLLVHDDIEDGDRIRRDQPTVWVKYGLAHGINVGDYMAHKVFELVLRSKEQGVGVERTNKLVSVLTEAALRTAEGQTMDINMRGNDSPTESDYIEMIIGKTAHYLTVPMVGALIVSGREDLIKDVIEFGKNLGPAFQIADDILDLTEGKGRKETGRDIKEGKKSILVIHCLGRCGQSERKNLLAILNKPPEETTDSDVSYVKSLFSKYGSVEYAKRLAESYTEKAKKIASRMPPSLAEILEFFADYAVQRRR